MEPRCTTPVFAVLHDVVKVLAIEHPQDVNSPSFTHEETPLHLTSRVGHLDVAQLLIKHGVDAAAQSTNGTTPRHLGPEQGYADLIELLIEQDADMRKDLLEGFGLLLAS